MKYGALAFLLSLFACGGKLSDEQRERLREGMEEQKIVRMSDAEILTAALDVGRAVVGALNSSDPGSAAIDSIAHQYRVKIRKLIPGSDRSLDIENQVIDAYILSAATGEPGDSLQDNIQRLRLSMAEDYDSLLYTQPVVEYLPDGAINVLGVWNVYLSKREVIRGAGTKP